MPWRTVVGAGALAVRYAAGRRVEPSWPAQLASRLTELGEVDRVSILPLVERLVPDSPEHPGGRLRGEPGVAYLLRTDKASVLFDVGLNLGGQARPTLVSNADLLGIDLGSLDGVVISHLHLDHVGGPGNQRRRRFSFAAEPLEPRGARRCPHRDAPCVPRWW